MQARDRRLPSSIIGMLSHHLDVHPGRVCFREMAPGHQRSTVREVTFDDLANVTWHAACAFWRKGGKAGDRVIIAVQDPIRNLGCLLGVLTAEMRRSPPTVPG